MPASGHRLSWRALLLLVVAAAALALLIARWSELTEGYLAFSRGLAARGGGPWSAALFVLFSAISVLLAPFSTGPLVPAAVLAWGHLPVLGLLLLGWMLGNAATYWLGWKLPRVREWKGFRAVERRVRELDRHELLFLAVLLRMTLPSEIGYVYGALRFSFRWYLVLTLLAELPPALLLVWGSQALIEGRTLQLIAIAVAAAALLITGFVLRRARARTAAAGA